MEHAPSPDRQASYLSRPSLHLLQVTRISLVDRTRILACLPDAQVYIPTALKA